MLTIQKIKNCVVKRKAVGVIFISSENDFLRVNSTNLHVVVPESWISLKGLKSEN